MVYQAGNDGETPACATVTVRIVEPWKVNSGGCYIGSIEFEISELMIDTRRPASDVAVPEILSDTGHGEQLHTARRQRVEVGLKSSTTGTTIFSGL